MRKRALPIAIDAAALALVALLAAYATTRIADRLPPAALVAAVR